MPEDQSEITLGVLNAVEENDKLTQRDMARELGVALGLVNSYLKRCIKKGYVKIRHVPANRYSYYLTPAGFAEKSRLTAEYLSSSFNFFRNARRDCARILETCDALGHRRVVIAAATDLAEIVFLCAQEHAVEIVGIIDEGRAGGEFLGLPVFGGLAAAAPFDAVIIADLSTPQAAYDALIAELPAERVFAPSILGVKGAAALVLAGGAE